MENELAKDELYERLLSLYLESFKYDKFGRDSFEICTGIKSISDINRDDPDDMKIKISNAVCVQKSYFRFMFGY